MLKQTSPHPQETYSQSRARSSTPRKRFIPNKLCVLQYFIREQYCGKEMAFINTMQLSKLIQNCQNYEQITKMITFFRGNYNVKILAQDFDSLVDLAISVNKREKTKNQRQTKEKNVAKGELFVYGEFKLFSWALLLYCIFKGRNLQQFGEEDYRFMAKLFKQKSQCFIEYEVKCMLFAVEKNFKEWLSQEIVLFEAISKEFSTDDWKLISYHLFLRSERKYFRSFQQCREKWINHINPSVKKGEWEVEEDIELFRLVISYGCRWALISRQLKGTRSEHAIKNRYNSVIKTMRRQYKITSTQQIEQKVLKYLKFKSGRKQKKSQELDLSLSSKGSKDRSREVKLHCIKSQSQVSSLSEEKEDIFSDIFNVQLQSSNTAEDISSKYFPAVVYDKDLEEEKKEKRTWESQYEVIDGQIMLNGNDGGQEESNVNAFTKDNQIIQVAGFEQDYNELLHSDFISSRWENMIEVRENVRNALGCGHLESLLSDDWLFDGHWEVTEE